MAKVPSVSPNSYTVDTIVTTMRAFPRVIAFGLHEVQHGREEK